MSVHSTLGVGGEERLNRSSVIFQIPAFFTDNRLLLMWSEESWPSSLCETLVPALGSSVSAAGDSSGSEWHLLCWCAACTPVSVFVPLELCHLPVCTIWVVTNPSLGLTRKQTGPGSRTGLSERVSKTRSGLCSSVPVEYSLSGLFALVLGCCFTAGDSGEEDEDPTKCCTKSRGSCSPLPSGNSDTSSEKILYTEKLNQHKSDLDHLNTERFLGLLGFALMGYLTSWGWILVLSLLKVVLFGGSLQ